MQYRVEATYTEFQAGEAAELSGVSQPLQRDWRRRGILEEHKGPGRMRYTLSEIALLKITGMLSAGGISVKGARAVAGFVAAKLLLILESLPGSFEIVGAQLDDEDRRRFMDEVPQDRGASFVFVPLPERSEGDALATAYFLRSPAEVSAVVGKDGAWTFGLLFDLEATAKEIVAKASRPLISYRLFPEDEA